MSSPSSTELPPDIANQLATSNYVLVGSTTVLVWDVLCHLSDDYDLISRHRFTFPLFIYFVSRIANLLLLMGWCISGTTLGVIDNCLVVQLVFNAIYAIAVPSSQLLFFLPIRAIWINRPRIVWPFTALWIATAVSHLSPLIVLSIADNCHSDYSSMYTAIPAIAAFVNDTLLCLALVWRIVLSTTSEAEHSKTWMWVTLPIRASTPQIARALLYNGCGYYLCALCITLPVIVMGYVTTLPVVYRTMLGYPAIGIINIMASRIYRKIKLGHFNLEASATSGEAPSRLVFATSGVAPVASVGMDPTFDVERGVEGPPQGGLNDSSSHSSTCWAQPHCGCV